MLIIIFSIFVALCMLFCPGSSDNNNTLGFLELNSDIKPIVEEIDGRDWNGEGRIYKEFYFERDEDFNNILEQINKDSDWHKTILDEDFYYLLNYGAMDKKAIGTEIYYYFVDRYHYYNNQELIDKYDYKEYYKRKKIRYSTNYTAAALDINNRRLYFYEIDT